MTTAAPIKLNEIEILRHQAHITSMVLHMNVDGFTQKESLIQPAPGGNCLNWVVGHLVCVYCDMLPLVGQERVMSKEALQRYARGTPPLQDPAEAVELSALLGAWDTATQRIDCGLTSLGSQDLDAPAPFSPTKNPNETVRSLLTTVLFHQAYHAGQAGILRRIAGKAGAIA